MGTTTLWFVFGPWRKHADADFLVVIRACTCAQHLPILFARGVIIVNGARILAQRPFGVASQCVERELFSRMRDTYQDSSEL